MRPVCFEHRVRIELGGKGWRSPASPGAAALAGEPCARATYHLATGVSFLDSHGNRDHVGGNIRKTHAFVKGIPTFSLSTAGKNVCRPANQPNTIDVFDIREKPGPKEFNHIIIGGAIRSGITSPKMQNFIKLIFDS